MEVLALGKAHDPLLPVCCTPRTDVRRSPQMSVSFTGQLVLPRQSICETLLMHARSVVFPVRVKSLKLHDDLKGGGEGGALSSIHVILRVQLAHESRCSLEITSYCQKNYCTTLQSERRATAPLALSRRRWMHHGNSLQVCNFRRHSAAVGVIHVTRAHAVQCSGTHSCRPRHKPGQ